MIRQECWRDCNPGILMFEVVMKFVEPYKVVFEMSNDSVVRL